MQQIDKKKPGLPTEFSDLPLGEQIVLWGFRMWAKAYNQNTNISYLLQEGFRLAGISEAFTYLNSLMHIFASSGKGSIDIHYPNCSNISIDEHRILGAIAAYQNDKDFNNCDPYLSFWLSPAALRMSRAPMLQLANTLKKKGLLFVPRPWSLTLSVDNLMNHTSPDDNHTIH